MPSTDLTSFHLVRWCLRLVVWLQCLGVAGRYWISPSETESDVYGWLYFDHAWPEFTAQRIDDVGALACLACGWLLIIGGLLQNAAGSATRSRWSAGLGRSIEAVAAALVGGWMLALAASRTVRGELYAELTLGEQAVRYAAPLALLLFCSLPQRAERLSAMILRIACAATFAVHGYKAMQGYSPFTDLILLSDARWLGSALTQSTAERMLLVIGIVDLIVAGALIALRWPGPALYMALWGAVTAASRITALGESAWAEVLIRSANWGAPLAVLLLWPQVGSAAGRFPLRRRGGQAGTEASSVCSSDNFSFATRGPT